MTGRTGSWPGPARTATRWAWRWPSWWSRCWCPAGQPVPVAIDDTLFRRRGKKVRAAAWFHDGSAQGKHKTGRGNNWVVLAIVVRLPFCTRPVALPVMAKLVVKGTSSASRLWLARRMTQLLAAALPGRDLHAVADSAYAGEELKKLGTTSRGRPGSARTPPCTGSPRAHRQEGPAPRPRRPPPHTRRARRRCRIHAGHRHPLRQGQTIHAAALTCLWYSVFGSRPVQVILIRDNSATGYDLALVTTDPTAGPAQVIERYAARWSIEVAIEDAKQVFGAGQARNRTAQRGPPHHPVPARLPDPRHHLVRHRRPPPRRRRRATAPAPPGTPPRPSHRPPT